MMTKNTVDVSARRWIALLTFSFLLFRQIPAECQSWKQSVRGFMGELSRTVGDGEVGSLPAGIEKIDLPGVKGLRVDKGIGDLDLHAWNGEPGLLGQFRKTAEADGSLVAAINGSFFGTQGVLGQLVVCGKRPQNIRQMPRPFPVVSSRFFGARVSEDGFSAKRRFAERPSAFRSFFHRAGSTGRFGTATGSSTFSAAAAGSSGTGMTYTWRPTGGRNSGSGKKTRIRAIP